jgi:hypothetical protein
LTLAVLLLLLAVLLLVLLPALLLVTELLLVEPEAAPEGATHPKSGPSICRMREEAAATGPALGRFSAAAALSWSAVSATCCCVPGSCEYTRAAALPKAESPVYCVPGPYPFPAVRCST